MTYSAKRFDAFAISIISATSRRRLLGGLFGGALGLRGLFDAEDAWAKKGKCKPKCDACAKCKKGKHGKKGKCQPESPGTPCDGGTCCLALGASNNGKTSCEPTGTVCCSAAEGGGRAWRVRRAARRARSNGEAHALPLTPRAAKTAMAVSAPQTSPSAAQQGRKASIVR